MEGQEERLCAVEIDIGHIELHELTVLGRVLEAAGPVFLGKGMPKKLLLVPDLPLRERVMGAARDHHQYDTQLKGRRKNHLQKGYSQLTLE